jgi:hypothetical protein
MIAEMEHESQMSAKKSTESPELLISQWVNVKVKVPHTEVQIKNLKYENRFRVNIYSEKENLNCFVNNKFLLASYHLEVINGEIRDLTL